MTATYEQLVLMGGLVLLTILVVQGKSIFVAAPLCAAITVGLSGIDPLSSLSGPYMTGFADFVRRFYLVVALGAVFGKLMEESGGAISIADSFGRTLGKDRACLAVVLSCAALTYGGVSVFAVGFSVFPLALQLFRQANLPRRFIPGAICLGSITFTMTSAGSPEIQNLIPIQYLVDTASKQPLTDARAGWPVSLIVGTLMFAVGQWYLEWSIANDVRKGQKWEDRAGETSSDFSEHHHTNRPRAVLAFIPLIVTVAALNLLPLACRMMASLIEPDLNGSVMGSQSLHRLLSHFPEDPTLSIFLGVVAALVLFRGRFSNVWKSVGDGFTNGFIAIGSTAAIVGFGAAVKDLAAYQRIVDWVTHIPGDPLWGAALAIAVIAAIAGSASGGQAIALPILKPIYIDELGVAPRALHRVVAIASGSLDTLPANGFVVMLIRVICGETHQRAYGPIFVTTVLVPIGGTALAICLFKLVPQWAQM